MKAFYFFVIFVFFISVQAKAASDSPLCNDVLSGFSAGVQSSIRELAQLRFDLDQRLARGEGDVVTRALQLQYLQKETEILAAAKIERKLLIAKVRTEIESLQRQSNVEESNQKKTKSEQSEEIQNNERSIHGLGRLIEKRGMHAQSVLPDGRILITGGVAGVNRSSSVELFDPATGTSEVIGHLNDRRSHHFQATLPDGRVYVVGGFSDHSTPVNSVELIDPVNRTIQKVGELESAVWLHDQTESLLPDGRILIVGGVDLKRTASVVLIDPMKLTVEKIGNLKHPRSEHTQSVLPDGRVLIVGGKEVGSSITSLFRETLASIELIDPAKKTIEVIGNLHESRSNHTQGTLPDGRVLVTGGTRYSPTPDSIEVIDPVKKTVEKIINLEFRREDHQQVTFPDGRVLIIGGRDSARRCVGAIELIDPIAKTVERIGSLNEARAAHGVSFLKDGQVLVIGGVGEDAQKLRSVEMIQAGRR